MVKIYVMESCPDCTRVKEVASRDRRFELVDIGEHIHKLKEFLRLRDTREEFAEARRLGYAGIPAFLMPDGSVTFSAAEAGLDLCGAGSSDLSGAASADLSGAADLNGGNEEATDGASCSIDGRGC